MATRFSQRADTVEIMDNLQCSGEVVDQTLRELEIINRWLGGNAVTINGIKRLLSEKTNTNNKVTIADIGCGGGDILKEIAIWGRENKLDLLMTGIDANPNIIQFAKKNTESFSEINYQALNVFSKEFLATNYDIIVATLFTHHFNNQDLAQLIKSVVKQSKIGVVINDLHRHWLAYHSIRLLTKWFSKSPMVQFDAPVSVLRSFHRSDIQSILKDAGVKNYQLKWKWAFRWQLIIPASLA
ncbi:MAG: methyltransferase domain-containing protein [Cyclobacteriaceae bacterium]